MLIYREEIDATVKVIVRTGESLDERQRAEMLIELEQYLNSMDPLTTSYLKSKGFSAIGGVQCYLRFHFRPKK